MSSQYSPPSHNQVTILDEPSLFDSSPVMPHDFSDPFESFNEDVSPMEFSPSPDFSHMMGYPGHPLDTMAFSDSQYPQSPLLFKSTASQNLAPSASFNSLYSLDDPLGAQMPLRPPQIHIDTSSYNHLPLSQVLTDGATSPQTPYEVLGVRRASLATPSTSSSYLTTPEHSPGHASHNIDYSKSNVSPISPTVSLANMFERQAVSLPRELRTPDRPRQGSPTVADIVRESMTPSDGILVPQKTYRPHTLSDRRRYVEEVDLESPIMFFSQNPRHCGISLPDALNGRFMNLADRDDHMFINRGPSVSIRLMWPGYAPWSKQIPTRDFRTPPQPITRAKLAKNVAKTIQRFIQDMETRPMEEDAIPRWRVGSGHIQLHNLTLVGLQHVSMGSWQAYVVLSPGSPGLRAT